MAKQKPVSGKNKATEANLTTPKIAPVPASVLEQKDASPQHPMFSFKVQTIVIVIIGLIFYANTFKNTWAYDDSLVILSNEYVNQGFGGLAKIFTVDEFDSYVRSQNEVNNQLTGGRYRPLSIATYAVEQQFLGLNVADTSKNGQTQKAEQARMDKLDRDMHVRHVVNVLLFLVSVVVLLLFLRKTVFVTNPLAAFLTAIIFLIHPIHTEVVANVKSRDEILSLLFILLTFLKTFDYQRSRKMNDMILANVCFFLALLSKEYGVMLLVLVPLSLYLLKGYTPRKSFQTSATMLITTFLYFMLRVQSANANAMTAEPDVMNNPYLFADAVQSLATRLAVLFDYFKLLIIPHPLIADYTYNQVPYVDFSNWRALASIILNGGLIALMVILIRKKHVMGFALAIYFGFLLLISNFLVNIGSTMGERLIYHSSLGFAMGAGYLLWMLFERIPSRQAGTIALVVIMIGIAIPSAAVTFARNNTWASNVDLFLTDVKTATGSVIINANAGRASMEMADKQKTEAEKEKWVNTGVSYLSTAIKINPRYIAAYVNRALCYMRLGQLELALPDCDTINKYYPTHPSLPYISGPLGNFYTSQALYYAQNNKPDSAFIAFKKAADAAPQNPDYLYNIAFAYCQRQDFRSGKMYVQRALAINPQHASSLQLMAQISRIPGI